jgi:type IV pilus assembly protein PilQ
MKLKFSRLLISLILGISCLVTAGAQDKYQALQEKLTTLSNNEIPVLNEKVNVSVTNVSIQEFIRGIANSSALNINVDPAINVQIINNFSNVRVLDVLLFLCKQYDLNISVIGTILNIYKEKVEELPPPKKQLVTYDSSTRLVSIECNNVELAAMAKAFVDQTGYNLVPASGLEHNPVSGYIQKMPIEGALEKFTFANNLKIRKTEDQVYLIERNDPTPSPQNNNRKNGTNNQKRSPGETGLEITRLSTDSIAISADNASLSEIITSVADALKADYFISTPVQGEASFKIKAISYPSLLDFIFRNTNYSYQKIKGIYLIGDNKTREMKEFRMVQLQNRPIDKLIETIPDELTRDLDIKNFPDLNGFLVGGVPGRVQAFENFLKSIDQVVPVILIEVIIIDIENSHTVTTGIESGLGENPTTTQGTVFPGVDMSLGSQSINNLINSFNGFGTVKIGKVSSNFYINLKALETNGIVNIRSTPKLSTLNGHEAEMSIGETQYYLEEQSNTYGSLSTQQTVVQNYKEVKAEMKVKIKPVVSGDDQITLEIEVTQSDFTDVKVTSTGPPGQTSRTFKSLIRVKNEEMVLLGGLEEKKDKDSGSGVPLLSRIPVIKWFFSSKTKEHSNAKLEFFIKPTIIQ